MHLLGVKNFHATMKPWQIIAVITHHPANVTRTKALTHKPKQLKKEPLQLQPSQQRTNFTAGEKEITFLGLCEQETPSLDWKLRATARQLPPSGR